MLMCGLKTGCLARFAALVGAEAARLSPVEGPSPTSTLTSTLIEESLPPLGAAAQKLGVGFQILDDVRNLKTGVPGKKRGDDVVEGKKSLPVLLFLRAGTDPDAERLAFVLRCFKAAREGGADVPEVGEFITALTGTGALAEAEEQGKTLIAEARAAFSALPAADGCSKRLLTDITELLLGVTT
jgi:octaprenyl-diphosphate synthase